MGAGPGGYTAAFRAADLGQNVVLVDSRPTLGGVCLNVGCIPSKALLHVAKVIDDAKAMGSHGVSFGAPTFDSAAIRGWKDGVVKRLTGGLIGLAKQRKVKTVTGEGKFTSANTLRVETAEGARVVRFNKAIIAAGSEPAAPGFIPADPRIWDSTGALEINFIPKRMLVLGGGIIGLEMATVYHALGAGITVIEMMDQLMPGADLDIVAPLAKRIGRLYEKILLKTKVTAVKAEPDGLKVTYEGPDGSSTETFDAILVSVGRRPNGARIGAAAAGVAVDERGYIAVDRQMRTNVPHIFAIGDIVGQPMLAHKATHEAKVAAEVASGHKSSFDAKAIPSVAYTDPEVAWAGVTETEAKAKGVKYGKAVFPWAASGRSLSLGRDEGLTKTLWDEETQRLIGCGIVGPNAGDLISEAALAIEMGAEAEDIGLTSPSAPDALGDLRHVGRGLRRDADRPLYAEEEVAVPLLPLGEGGPKGRMRASEATLVGMAPAGSKQQSPLAKTLIRRASPDTFSLREKGARAPDGTHANRRPAREGLLLRARLLRPAPHSSASPGSRRAEPRGRPKPSALCVARASRPINLTALRRSRG